MIKEFPAVKTLSYYLFVKLAALVVFVCLPPFTPTILLADTFPIQEGAAEGSPKAPWGDFSKDSAGESPWWSTALLWLPNRIMDALDLFRVDAGIGPAAGGVVRFTHQGQAAYRRMYPASFRIGYFGRREPFLVETSDEVGAGAGFKQSAQRDVCTGEVGVGADALIAGAYAGICFDELIDFLGGIVLFDPKGDDF